MHILWGILIIAVGLFMVVCASMNSEFIIYRLFVARSKILWGEHVHRFYQVAGIMVIVFGVALGTSGKKMNPTRLRPWNPLERV